MTYGTPAPGSDRLPWLPDERRSPRIGAVAIFLSFAVWVAVVAAAVSYSPWPISFDALDNFRPRSRAAADAPVTRQAEPEGEVYGNLQAVPEAALPTAPPPSTVPPPTAIAPVAPALVAARHSPPPAAPTIKLTAATSAGASTKAAAESASRAAQSPDLECRSAKTRAALALCSNRSLAILDREHALIYNQSWRYADAGKRAQLQRARQRMASTLSACQTDACTSSTYLSGMREVSSIMSAKPAPSAAKPSFSCRGARKPGQIAVCNDTNLAALDRHQTLLYNQSWGRADRAKRAQLARAQRRLVSRRDSCTSEPCAKSAYLASMKEVAEIMTKN
jgi:uncharacterized protein